MGRSRPLHVSSTVVLALLVTLGSGCIFGDCGPYDEVQDQASAVVPYAASASHFRATVRVRVEARAEVTGEWDAGGAPVFWVDWSVGAAMLRCSPTAGCDALDAGESPLVPWSTYLQGGPTLAAGERLEIYARPGDPIPAEDPNCAQDTGGVEIGGLIGAVCERTGPCSRTLEIDVEGEATPASEARLLKVFASVSVSGDRPPRHEISIAAIDIEPATDGSRVMRGSGCPSEFPPIAGTGGSGGSAGGADDAGTDDPCPNANPNCSEEVTRELCSTLVTCHLIPGAALTEERCLLEIDARCANCLIDSVTQDGGTDAPGCSAALPDDCRHACNLLIASPVDADECLAIASGQPDTPPAFAFCLCDQCLSEYAACIADDGCWLVRQCASAVGCQGMACYAPDTCMAIIDEVGSTSISVAMATELGNCTKGECDVLK